MKLIEAQNLINQHLSPATYRVKFEWIDGDLLRSDVVPDTFEPGFASESEAKKFGEQFADALKGRAVNFYIVNAKTFAPQGTWERANR